MGFMLICRGVFMGTLSHRWWAFLFGFPFKFNQVPNNKKRGATHAVALSDPKLGQGAQGFSEKGAASLDSAPKRPSSPCVWIGGFAPRKRQTPLLKGNPLRESCFFGSPVLTHTCVTQLIPQVGSMAWLPSNFPAGRGPWRLWTKADDPAL